MAQAKPNPLPNPGTSSAPVGLPASAPVVPDTPPAPQEEPQNGGVAAGQPALPTLPNKPKPKLSSVPSTKVTGQSTMSKHLDRAVITPCLTRIRCVAEWIAALLPKVCYSGFTEEEYVDYLTYATLFQLERTCEELTKVSLVRRSPQMMFNVVLEFPDLIASFIEGFSPYITGHDIRVEVSTSGLRSATKNLCESLDYPFIEEQIYWDTEWLQRYISITTRIKLRDYVTLRPVHVTKGLDGKSSLIGSGILMESDTDDACLEARNSSMVQVVGKRLSARGEAIMAAFRPFYYYQYDEGVFLPYVEAGEAVSAPLLANVYRGIPWGENMVKFSLLTDVGKSK